MIFRPAVPGGTLEWQWVSYLGFQGHSNLITDEWWLQALASLLLVAVPPYARGGLRMSAGRAQCNITTSAAVPPSRHPECALYQCCAQCRMLYKHQHQFRAGPQCCGGETRPSTCGQAQCEVWGNPFTCVRQRESAVQCEVGVVRSAWAGALPRLQMDQLFW